MSDQTPQPGSSDTSEVPSASNQTTPTATKPAKSPKFPWKMCIWSAILIAGFILPKVFIAEIEDASGFGLDFVGIMSLGFAALLFLSWVVWALFFSRLRWWRRIFIAALVGSFPIAFLAFFEPVGGDLNGWRLKSKREALSTKVTPAKSGARAVDLKPESAADFAGYLGPNHNGVVDDIDIDESKFEQSKVLWKKPIGEGWSAFAARNGFAVTMEQRGVEECVTCYEVESGDLRWIYTHNARHDDMMGKLGPRATPTISDGKVYACGALGNFVCLNGEDGSVLWQKDLNEILGIELEQVTEVSGDAAYREANYRLAWGRSGSPLVVDDMVVIPGGGPGTAAGDGEMHTLLAFDKMTGDLKWKGGDQMIGYATPTVMELAGRRQIVITAEALIMGFDIATGETLWSWSRPGQSNAMANTSQLTLVSPNQLLSSKGYPDGGGELLEFTNRDGKITPKSVWQIGRVLKTKLTSPLLYKGHTYALTNGFLECTRVSDGKRMWKQRGRFGHGQYLILGDKLLLHSEGATRTAKLYLIDPSPDGYKELGSFETIDGVSWNTLCLYGNKLLVRSDQEAACFELPMK